MWVRILVHWFIVMLMKDCKINCPMCYEAGKAAEPKARKLDVEMKENAKQMRGVN